MTIREIKIVLMISGVILSMVHFGDGKSLRRYRRGSTELQQSYIVHYNSKGDPLTVAGFDDFVRVLNGQRGSSIASFGASPFSAEKSEESSSSSPFPGVKESPRVSDMRPTTSNEAEAPDQPGKFVAQENSTPLSPPDVTTTARATLESEDAEKGATEIPAKQLSHELSGPTPTPEASSSTEKAPLILALGHDAAAASFLPLGGSSSNFINLVTPGGGYSLSKTSLSALGEFPNGASLPGSKLISLQPRLQTVLNYAPSSFAIRDYVPAAHASYVQALSPNLQRPYTTQPETTSYGSYPENNSQMIVRQSPQLIDIGQGLGQGYGSFPQEIPINLQSGWNGAEDNGRRGFNQQEKPFLSIAKLSGYGVPIHSSRLSKIGFGPGSW